jgi:hypothetical protein
MEVKMQTSFIPKKPIIESQSRGSSVSIFFVISVILFIIAVGLAVGVWFWQQSLVAQIKKDKDALEKVRTSDSFQEKTINDLVRFNDRIEEAKGLLDRHLAVSPIFSLLEKNTLKNVSIKSMKFSYAGSDKTKLDLSGVAANYDALFKQSEAFDKESLISQPTISDFSLNSDGTVAFNFTASVIPSLVLYKNTIIEATTTPATVASSTTPNTPSIFDMFATSTVKSSLPNR